MLFFNVPNFISSLFCTAITKRETESEREGGGGVSDILNLFLALLLLLNNSIKCIFTICTCIWNNQRGVSLQRETSLQMQILKGVRGEGSRGFSFRCAVNKLMMKS